MKFIRNTVVGFLLAVVLGASLGLFVYAYWLVDFFPVGSRRLVIIALLVGAVAIAGYFYLIRWLQSQLTPLTKRHRWQIVGFGLLMGLFLLFAGTTQWQTPNRYLDVFLPAHTLEIVVPAEDAPRTLSISWFHTALEDVSANEIDLRGWSVGDDHFTLEAPANNRFYWEGKTGEYLEVVFQVRGVGQATASCDGEEETVVLSLGQVRYRCNLDIPWYASRGAVLLLGMLSFAMLGISLVALIREKYPALSLSWVESVSANTKWVKSDVLLLLAFSALALLLRVPNIENPYPAVDEYYHLIAARQIGEGIPMSEVYQRSLWLVTLPVSLSLKIFGNEIWAARLVGALFNVAALTPLYFLTRKINRPIAILSVGLYALSPWIITFSRLVREYAYYPFYFYFIIYGMVSFINSFPQRFAISRDWKALLTSRVGLLGIALIFPMIFPFFDPNSTFKLIWPAYVVLAVFILRKCDLKDRGNVIALFSIALLPILVLTTGRAFNPSWLGLTFNPHPLNYFFGNPPQQFYYDRFTIMAGLGFILAVMFSWIMRRENIIPPFILNLYLAFIAVFVFLFQTERFFRTRHLLAANLWFVILFAIGIYAIWSLLTIILSTRIRGSEFILAVFIAACVLNIPHSLVPVSAGAGVSLISEDDYFDMSPVHKFMRENANPEDILIATTYDLYVTWKQEPKFSAIYPVSEDLGDLLSITRGGSSGWMVIDDPRIDFVPASLMEFLSNNDFEYIGLFGEQHVWHWH
jgi:hypothetical protein